MKSAFTDLIQKWQARSDQALSELKERTIDECVEDLRALVDKLDKKFVLKPRK